MATFFLPLAAAQILQTLRNPVLDAGISRAIEPASSLAAFAVVASVVMILSASGTAIQSAYLVLVQGKQSYSVVRRYMFIYTGIIALIAILISLPGLGESFFRSAIGTPDNLLPDVMTMMRIVIAVPIFNLIRQFYLVQLAHQRHSHLVWIAPGVGELVLIVLALGVIPRLSVPGGFSGAIAWLVVAVIEGTLTFVLARRINRRVPYDSDPKDNAPLDFQYVTSFLVPLLITQFALVIAHPLITAGLLRLPDPEFTVAAFRIAFSLSMLPMTAMAPLRQVVMVLGRESGDHRRARVFVYAIGCIMSGMMVLIAFTPLNRVVVEGLIGAPKEIVPDAIVAMQIFTALPLFMAIRQFYQSMTMNQRKTVLVAVTAAVRLSVLVALLFVMTPMLGWTGAGVGAVVRIGAMGTEAIAAYIIGRKYFEMDAATRRVSKPEAASSIPVRSQEPD